MLLIYKELLKVISHLEWLVLLILCFDGINVLAGLYDSMQCHVQNSLFAPSTNCMRLSISWKYIVIGRAVSIWLCNLHPTIGQVSHHHLTIASVHTVNYVKDQNAEVTCPLVLQLTRCTFSTVLIIRPLRALSMLMLCSKILYSVSWSSHCWYQYVDVLLYWIAGTVSSLFGEYVPSARVSHTIGFIIRPVCPWYPPPRTMGRVTAQHWHRVATSYDKSPRM